MWASDVEYLFFFSVNTIKAYKTRRPAFAYSSDRKVLHQVGQSFKRLQKILKHNTRVVLSHNQRHLPRSQRTQRVLSAVPTRALLRGTGPRLAQTWGFRILGIAAWLQIMLWTAEEAVRAPQEAHISGNACFLPLAMGLPGLIFFLHSNTYNTHC